MEARIDRARGAVDLSATPREIVELRDAALVAQELGYGWEPLGRRAVRVRVPHREARPFLDIAVMVPVSVSLAS